MSDHTRLRILLPIAVCASTFLTTGCVQPLGPGFRFADRNVEIRPDSAAADRLQVRVADHLDNAGNRPLRSLEVRLPDGPASGTASLRVTIDGHEVSPRQVSPDADGPQVEMPFDPAWEKSQRREVITQWDLLPGASSREAVSASGTAFYLADPTGLPMWQAPKGFFARGGPTPIKEDLTVVAPKDFRVLAPGSSKERRAQGASVTRRFLIKPLVDFPPYVVAGRYQEQTIKTPQGVVVFWTFQPLDAPIAKTAALRLASSLHAFTDYFGPASKEPLAIHVVEAPVDLPTTPVELTGGTSFPDGVLLDRRNFAGGFHDETVLELAEYELSQTWFAWRVRPEMTVRTLMSRGTGIFSEVVAAESRNPAARRDLVTSLLEHYDQAKRTAADTSLYDASIGSPPEVSREERVTAGYKAGLFFVALEDLCGRDNLSSAFKNLFKDRGGDTVNQNDLRAALEGTSHRDLAEVFRLWLNRPGIPDEFRASYARVSTSVDTGH